jgi:lipopolysaccharide transport system permease protein
MTSESVSKVAWRNFVDRGPVGFLIRHRHLLLELVKRDIRDRYTGRVLGSIWAIASPLALMGIYVAVFSYMWSVRLADIGTFRGEYPALLISGLIPWLVIQEVLARATTSVSSQPALVRQIAFPTAALPVKTVLSAFPLVIATTLFLFVYQFIEGPYPPLTALALPLYWIVFTLYAIGLAFTFSALAVFFRDFSELLSLVFAGGLFLAPIMFIPGITPRWLETVFYFNPFSYPIWVHKDLAFNGAILNPVGWIGFGALTIVFFFGGTYFFAKVEDRFGDAL